MPVDYMLRPDSELTVRKLRTALGDKGLKTVLVDLDDVNLDIAGEVALGFKKKEAGDQEVIEIPYTEATMLTLASYFEVPVPFLKREGATMQQVVFDTILARSKGEVLFEFTDDRLVEIRAPHLEKIDPRRVLDVAARVVGDDAHVISGWRESGEYRFDVVVRDGADFGIGGDPKVNDITKGGLRFGQNTKQRLAPWVQPFYYRLVCTNGMEVPNEGLKVSFKGNTVAQVLQELELAARRAFEEVEHQIEAFYDLRNKKVKDAEQMVLRLAREQRISPRATTDLVERLPALMEDPSDASFFDVVNAITNYANLPDLLDRPDRQRIYELAGGSIVAEHAERCPRCMGQLV